MNGASRNANPLETSLLKAEAMNETNEPVVPKASRGVILSQENHGGVIKEVKAPPVLLPQ
jgi:hypothetical protein